MRYLILILVLVLAPSVFSAEELPCYPPAKFGSFENVRFENRKVTFCRKRGGECFQFDVASGDYTRAASETLQTKTPRVKVETGAAGFLKACFADSCYDLPWKDGLQPTDVEDGSINPDKTAALIELKSGPVAAIIYDLKLRKETSRLSKKDLASALTMREDQMESPMGHDPDEMTFTLPVSGTAGPILVAHRPCVRPCGWGALVHPLKKSRIAWIGAVKNRQDFFMSYDSAAIPVGGDVYAVLEGTAERVVIQNMRTGVLVGEISLRDHTQGMTYWQERDENGVRWPNWNFANMFADGKSLVLLLAGSANAKVLQIDPIKRVVTKSHTPKLCP